MFLNIFNAEQLELCMYANIHKNQKVGHQFQFYNGNPKIIQKKEEENKHYFA